MSSRVWFITGASSGFGRSLADAALERGDSIVATGRRTDSLAYAGEHERWRSLGEATAVDGA